MDCPSEEQMIRMKLEPYEQVKQLSFDTPNRTLAVYHMQASAIFTSNDIIVNGGVIVAGVLVYLLNSKWPDLVIGGIVFTFVMQGTIRILKLSK